MQIVRHLFLMLVMAVLLDSGSVFAKADLSLNVSDITFSKEEALAGDKVRVFARVFNVGDQDVYGFVAFLINDKEIAEPQPVSVKVNTYDDVFIDWIFTQGNFDVEAKIIATNKDLCEEIKNAFEKQRFDKKILYEYEKSWKNDFAGGFADKFAVFENRFTSKNNFLHLSPTL